MTYLKVTNFRHFSVDMYAILYAVVSDCFLKLRFYCSEGATVIVHFYIKKKLAALSAPPIFLFLLQFDDIYAISECLCHKSLQSFKRSECHLLKIHRNFLFCPCMQYHHMNTTVLLDLTSLSQNGKHS